MEFREYLTRRDGLRGEMDETWKDIYNVLGEPATTENLKKVGTLLRTFFSLSNEVYELDRERGQI